MSNLSESRHKLNAILKDHDVEEMREFIIEHQDEFEALDPNKVAEDQYVFDLMHVYKSLLPYLGEEHYKSMDYCIARGLIEVSPEQLMLTNAMRGMGSDESNRSGQQNH